MRAAALALIAATACARGPVDDPTRVDRDDAIIYVAAVVDAALWIDGVYVGAVADLARGSRWPRRRCDRRP